MKFKIHPAIGIARVGDSTTDFYLAPEQTGDLPIECDQDGNAKIGTDGNEQPITTFKDSQQRVKRQAARFRVFAYDDKNPQGRELQIGDSITVVNRRTGQLTTGTLLDIQWTVYLANKKASWYEFKELDGEHGYEKHHPLRNADVTEPFLRQNLIIDPGPQTVSFIDETDRVAHFARGENPGFTQSFPPPLNPFSIDTLGEIRATRQDSYNRLLVLGGYGRSGSYKTNFGEPAIKDFVNNDGWFDDVSDGPVMARLMYQVQSQDGRPPDPGTPATAFAEVDAPAWVIVGYPRFAPQIVDIITMDETVYDVAVREFGYNVEMYGVPPFDGSQKPPDPHDANALEDWRNAAQWNSDYYPYFFRDIWPILERPNNFQWVMDFDPFTGGDPHDTGSGGNFDETQISIPPFKGENPDEKRRRAQMRKFLYQVLRKPGAENLYMLPSPNPGIRMVGMPFLCGDNPLTNSVVSKFLRLTDTQLFILKQWAEGKFINEKRESIPDPVPGKTGRELDHGVLGNLLGGAFCPGGETSWIIRNPAIYAEPYRIRHSPDFSLRRLAKAPSPLSLGSNLAHGLEPGDLTKYGGVPWQADFNECSSQDIDITYEKWNKIHPESIGAGVERVIQPTFWWPSHRPMEVFAADGSQVQWAQGIPQTNAGDFKMVTAWKDLGFILNEGTPDNPNFVQVERNDEKI